MSLALRLQVLVMVFVVVVIVTRCQTTVNQSESGVNTSTTQSPPSSSPSSSSTVAPEATSSSLIPSSSQVVYCTCDLHPAVCDIDCCCDHKCSDRDKRLFARCLEHKVTDDDEFSCYSTSVMYSVSSFNQFVTSSSSKLFCIEWDNVKKQEFFPDRKPFTSVAEVRKMQSRHSFGWHETRDQRTGSPSRRQFLRSGDVLHLLSTSSQNIGSQFSLQKWSLPHSLLSGSGLCDSRRPIRFLQSVTTSCLRYIFSLQENCKTFLNESEFEGRFVRRQSGDPVSSLVQQVLKERSDGSSPTTISPDSQVDQCLPHHHCLSLRDNSSPSIKSHFLSGQQPSCLNAVRGVSHQVFYDADDGIVRIETEIQRINLTGSRGYLRQFFRVTFTPLVPQESENGTDTSQDQEERELSGNPGYMRSAPLLTAVLSRDRTGNESSWEGIVRQKLQIPNLSRADGLCSADLIKMRDVSFGLNFRSSCFVQTSSLSSLPTSTSHAEGEAGLCARLQQHLTSIVGPESNVTHVAVYGNANVSLMSQWLPILSHTEWPQVRDASKTPSLSPAGECPLLVTGLSLEVYFALTGLTDEPQAKILSVIRKYTSQAGVKISTSADSGHVVEVLTSVSFFDMTHSRRTSFAPAPVLRLQLPADFFYPFFISSSAHLQPSLLVLTVLLLVIHDRTTA